MSGQRFGCIRAAPVAVEQIGLQARLRQLAVFYQVIDVANGDQDGDADSYQDCNEKR
ncbi:hypothetical protein D9M68_959760 [compost metagenome]